MRFTVPSIERVDGIQLEVFYTFKAHLHQSGKALHDNVSAVGVR